MKALISNHIKNIGGWTSSRKILVFAVDDYGNVRLNSKADRDALLADGMQTKSRFDLYDSLESKQDLEALYEVLNSVKDKHGKAAVFTPFAVCANMNFERLIESNFEELEIEDLPTTYSKLANLMPTSYDGAWDSWKQGIAEGFLQPQYHGREHFNQFFLKSELAKANPAVHKVIARRSYSFQNDKEYPSISYTATFDFSDKDQLPKLKEIAVDGVNRFEAVYGYRPIHFMAPTSKAHPMVLEALKKEGIEFVDQGRVHVQHQGDGVYSKDRNVIGKKNPQGQTVLVRNVVFEPNANSKAVAIALKQVEAAFRMRKPAIISSHRVNFCGHIEESNRSQSLADLNSLLKLVVQKYPEVEFMGTGDLCRIMANS
ncbi:hypothetical protein [Croceimicrobium hydrocarbonivorans]|uniref:Uncharacterized protein n=1 Tax=Croceimicrobium hydrocarbonivorans TaxID=2761580 RepID=A0A7H0VGA0_9FLAO|nr:hypothetical protein [Croceimicrobium hydrocarbonivorans]QNR24748.1 hypothetical protein H4K34_02580 [Croceimicrobium hydrocarbonivorans]